MGHDGRQACPDTDGYTLAYQSSKPISLVTDDEVDLGVGGPFWRGYWALRTVGFSGDEEGATDSFLPGGVGVGGVVGEPGFGGGFGRNFADLMAIVRRFVANKPPWARGSANLWRAGLASGRRFILRRAPSVWTQSQTPTHLFVWTQSQTPTHLFAWPATKVGVSRFIAESGCLTISPSHDFAAESGCLTIPRWARNGLYVFGGWVWCG